VYQLLPHGRWFSPGTPAFSTTNTGRHDIAEILLKVAIKHKKKIEPIIVVSTKCIDPWVLEFVVSNNTGNNQWYHCISLDLYFCSLSGPRNQRKLETHD
jgi:hypothetical protein